MMGKATTLQEMVELQVQKKPRTLAIVSEEESLTYLELNQRANQLAHYLKILGVKPDTQVALCLDRSPNFLIALLGILKAGGAYVPLDLANPGERLLLILQESNTSIVITEAKHKDLFSAYQGKLVLLDKEKNLAQQPQTNFTPQSHEQHLAYIIYTSGSTGKPKGVMLEHRGVVNYARWFAKYSGCTQSIDFSSKPNFDMAVTTSIVPLTLGLTIIICPDSIKKEPRRYLHYLKTSGVHCIKLTPSYLKELIHEQKIHTIHLPKLQTLILGGENLSTIDCAAWLDINPNHQLFNEYGPTETSVAVTAYAINRHNLANLGENPPIGYLADQVQACLIDKQGAVVPQGEIGELYLGGTCLARGYLNAPELTEHSFIHNPFGRETSQRWYKTGDLCRILPSGEYECLGRIDHQVKIRGFRIEPAEIENCLASHPAIQAAAVIASDKYRQEKRLIAYYILKNSAKDTTDNELKHYLARYLPDYMIPGIFVRMDAFPLTDNEKLDRLALPEPQFTFNHHYVAPKTKLEKQLVQFWEDELGVSPLGLKDDFFEAGGHSLSAARIISQIHHQLGKEITLSEFYQKPTIRQLNNLLKTRKKQSTTLAHNLANQTTLPLSNFQLLLWLADRFEPKAKRLNLFISKRLSGMIARECLTQAAEKLVLKHEVLSYNLSTIRPVQYLKKHAALQIEEYDLTSLTENNSQAALEQSKQTLLNFHPWPKNKAQLVIRLFKLKDDKTELQLCIPHILADDISLEILMKDLSEFYLENNPVEADIRYKDYLETEQHIIAKNLKRDIPFWESYLKDAEFFTFPSKYLTRDNILNYSTYIEIPEEALHHFQAFCAENHISLFDGLCAAFLRALAHLDEDHNSSKAICINRVKSTRHNGDYDNTLGCFLQLELLKLTWGKELTLINLAHKIQEAGIRTAPYQNCSNLIKLASIGYFHKTKHRVKSWLGKLGVWLYTCLFNPKVPREVLGKALSLHPLKGQHFPINFNVFSSFFYPHNLNEPTLFGLSTIPVQTKQEDLLQIDNFLDVCFLKHPEQQMPYLVISANLEPAFRKKLGQEVLKQLQAVIQVLA